jgi:adenylate kinase family enzyme
MDRIAIIGPSATGKSTLARRLGSMLDIPVHHLDALYWRPGWDPTPEDEWRAKLETIIASERWIVDGNFTASLRERVAAADVVIFLDLPRRLSFVGVFRRRIEQLRELPAGVAAGCPPMFNLRLLSWIWTFRFDHRPLYLRLLAEQPSTTVLIMRSRRDVRDFLALVEEQMRAAAG